ncbi:MAG: hypothetical protein Q7P63_03130 [Verrucomicrobiota bacterium JB022]|nr:hypothetical protein [Verrucomicrobiota bacterium JB022]
MDTLKLIKNVLDVPGVEGVCFHDLDGELLYADMPSFMIEEVYEDLLRRVVMLYEAVETHYVPVEDYLLKFQDMQLMLRKGKDYGMLILAQEQVNQMSLRMVTTMALRQLNVDALRLLHPHAGQNAKAAGTNGHAPAAAPAPTPAAQEPAAAALRAVRPTRPPTRLYRGRSY